MLCRWDDGQALLPPRLSPESGIAIGSILFIIAILAVLAAAIAAGSGSFTSGTTAESMKTEAATLLQIGNNLKVGVDLLISNNGITDPTLITYGTTLSTDLFSPKGGGITAPSTVYLQQTPGNPSPPALQYDLTQNVNGFGTSGAYTLFAYGYIGNTSQSLALCNEINALANGVTSPPTIALAIMATGTPPYTILFSGNFGALINKMTGCFYTNHVWSLGYWVYQVLMIQ